MELDPMDRRNMIKLLNKAKYHLSIEAELTQASELPGFLKEQYLQQTHDLLNLTTRLLNKLYADSYTSSINTYPAG